MQCPCPWVLLRPWLLSRCCPQLRIQPGLQLSGCVPGFRGAACRYHLPCASRGEEAQPCVSDLALQLGVQTPSSATFPHLPSRRFSAAPAVTLQLSELRADPLTPVAVGPEPCPALHWAQPHQISAKLLPKELGRGERRSQVLICPSSLLSPVTNEALTQEGEGEGKPGHDLPAAFCSEASEGWVVLVFFIVLFYIRS